MKKTLQFESVGSFKDNSNKLIITLSRISELLTILRSNNDGHSISNNNP